MHVLWYLKHWLWLLWIRCVLAGYRLALSLRCPPWVSGRIILWLVYDITFFRLILRQLINTCILSPLHLNLLQLFLKLYLVLLLLGREGIISLLLVLNCEICILVPLDLSFLRVDLLGLLLSHHTSLALKQAIWIAILAGEEPALGLTFSVYDFALLRCWTLGFRVMHNTFKAAMDVVNIRMVPICLLVD